MIPDRGIRIIKDREKVSMCRSTALDGEKWKEEFPELFDETLGKCQYYIVNIILSTISPSNVRLTRASNRNRLQEERSRSKFCRKFGPVDKRWYRQ